MKILLVCQHYYPEPFRVTEVAEGLVRRGHDVSVVTGIPNYPEGVFYSGYSKKERCEETINGVHVHRVPIVPRGKSAFQRLRNYLSFAKSAKKYVKTLPSGFDIVLVYQLSPVMMAEPGLLYGKLHHVPVIIYELDPWPSNLSAGGFKASSPIYRYFARISRKIYSTASHVFVSSKRHISYLNSLCGRSLPISYLPQFASENGEYKGGDGSEFHFLYAGNVGQALPIEVMLSSFSKACKAKQNLYLDIAGSGSALEEAKQYCKTHEISNVVFHGWLKKEKFETLSNKADAAIVLLNHQLYSQSTVPGKVSTYLKLGFPVLVADDGATKELIEEAKAGIAVPTSDEESLTKAFLEMAGLGKEKLLSYSKNGKAYYQENMAETRFFDSLEEKMRILKNN